MNTLIDRRKIYWNTDFTKKIWPNFRLAILIEVVLIKQKRVSGVPAKMTCLWGVGSVKVHETGYPNIFLTMKYLMAIFHAKGFDPRRIPSYLTIDIPRYHVFDMWKCDYSPSNWLNCSSNENCCQKLPQSAIKTITGFYFWAIDVF